MKAKAVVMRTLGGPEVLGLEEVDVPDPGPGEIRIQVKAFGLNRSEVLFREGRYMIKPVFPSRIGYEAAGIVESVGPGVEGFAVGDAVSTLPAMESNPRGAYGELFTLPINAAVKSHPGLSMVESAALWSSYMTAYGGLVDMGVVRPGDFVLVTAASSSLGPPAMQILKMLGARPIATTRQRSKAEAVRQFGAEHVIVTEEEDVVERVLEITGGKGVACVFDPVGGPMVAKLADVTAPYGTIIIYGRLSRDPGEMPQTALIWKNLTIRGYGMLLHENPARDARAIAFIRDGITKGHLRPAISKKFRLDEIVEAARFLDSMEQIGKVVVTV